MSRWDSLGTSKIQTPLTLKVYAVGTFFDGKKYVNENCISIYIYAYLTRDTAIFVQNGKRIPYITLKSVCLYLYYSRMHYKEW